MVVGSIKRTGVTIMKRTRAKAQVGSEVMLRNPEELAEPQESLDRKAKFLEELGKSGMTKLALMEAGMTKDELREMIQEDGAFSDAVRDARLGAVEDAIMQEALGYPTEEESVEHGPEGTRTKVTKRYARPSVEAAEAVTAWLHRMSEGIEGKTKELIKSVVRGTIYDPMIHPQQALMAMAHGATKDELCAEMGVCPQTIIDWRVDHPEFAKALEIGERIALAWWMKQGRANLHNKRFNFSVWHANMNARFLQFGWSKGNLQVSGQVDINHKGQVNVTLNDAERAQVVGILTDAGVFKPGVGPIIDAEVDEVHPVSPDGKADGVSAA
jgi:hypothetical protein